MDGWMATGIFWRESALIEQGLTLSWLGCTLHVSGQNEAVCLLHEGMKTCHFNCNAPICKRSEGKEGQWFPRSSFEGFSFEVALLIDPNPLSSCERGWV